jgi:AcrR family transcriptional regulator
MGRRKLDRHIDEKIMNEVMRQSLRTGICFVSTKEIAKKLGISEPVIFAHFKTKNDLMNSTFALAWTPFVSDPLFRYFQQCRGVISFESFKKGILETLTWKKEIAFLHYYLASSIMDSKLVENTTSSYFHQFVRLFKNVAPNVSEEDLALIARGLLLARIDFSNAFVAGDFETNDDNLRILFNFLSGGLEFAVKKLSATQESDKDHPAKASE